MFPVSSALEVIHKTQIILNLFLLPKNQFHPDIPSISTQDTDQAPTFCHGWTICRIGTKTTKLSACNAVKAT